MTIQFVSRLSQFQVLSATQRADRDESLEQTLLFIYDEEQVATLPLLLLEPVVFTSHDSLLLLLLYMRISIWAITVLQ